MMSTSFSAKIPGSAMLLGEHAVLHDYFAVVCAANHFITATLIPRLDEKIILHSALGGYKASLSSLQIQKPFEFILTAILLYKTQLKKGFELTIESGFSHEVGLGSSAAVTVATIKVLRDYLNFPSTDLIIFHDSVNVIRKVQGRGSGADVAASVFGGVIAYRIHPFQIEKLNPIDLPLSLFYSGSKMKTAEVLSYVSEKFKDQQKKLHEIYAGIGECANRGIAAIKQHDWIALGQAMNAQQIWMTTLGVTNKALQQWIDKLSQEKAVLGAKISGSGLGDCVIALGTPNINFLGSDPEKLMFVC